MLIREGKIKQNKNIERTDEEIGKLDVIPQVLPHFLLRRTSNMHEIATNLNVRAVDDRQVGADLLDQRDEAWHLRVIWTAK